MASVNKNLKNNSYMKKILLLSNDIRLDNEISKVMFNLIIGTSTQYEWINFGHYYNQIHPEFGKIVEIELSTFNKKLVDKKVKIYPINRVDSNVQIKYFKEVIELDNPDLVMLAYDDLSEYQWLFDDENKHILEKTPFMVYNFWGNVPYVYDFKVFFQYADKVITNNLISLNNAKSILDRKSANRVEILPPSIDKNVFYKIQSKSTLQDNKKIIFDSINTKYLVMAEANIQNIQIYLNFVHKLANNVRNKTRLVLINSNQSLIDWTTNNILDKIKIVHIPYSKGITDNELNTLYNLADIYIDSNSYVQIGYNTLSAIMTNTNVLLNNTGSNIDYTNVKNDIELTKLVPKYINIKENKYLVSNNQSVLQQYKNQLTYFDNTNIVEFSTQLYDRYKQKFKNATSDINKLYNLAFQTNNIENVSSKFIDMVEYIFNNFTKKNIVTPIKINNSFKGIYNPFTKKWY